MCAAVAINGLVRGEFDFPAGDDCHLAVKTLCVYLSPRACVAKFTHECQS